MTILLFSLILPVLLLLEYENFQFCAFAAKTKSGAKGDVRAIFSSIPDNVKDYAENGKHYKKDGSLIYYGAEDGYSEKISLFFKKEKTACTPDFNIRFCLIGNETSCTNGITICYDSQFKAKYNKQYYKEMNLHLRDDLDCENKTHFGFMVYTNGAGGKSATNFKIKATIDKHIYVFPIPEGKERCFVLNMGSENSLATRVRNIEGENLIFVGNPPVQFDNSTPSLQYSDTNYMNLWMLYLDFMPYFLPKFEYHEREIQFTGGGESCKMTVDFDTSSLNVCKEDQEFIGNCDTKGLDSSDMECTMELRASQSVEEGKETGTTRSETRSTSDTNSDTTRDESTTEWGVAAAFEAAIKTTGEGNLIFTKATIEAEFRMRLEAHFTQSNTHAKEKLTSNTVTTETSDGTSVVDTYKEVDERGKTVTLKIHRTDGGNVQFYQTVFMCAGQTYRYHKISAFGDSDHDKPYQSTMVYELRKEDEELANGTVIELDMSASSTPPPKGTDIPGGVSGEEETMPIDQGN